MRTLVITGTDTGVGKTVVACALLRHWAGQGRRVVGFKPVASGCERHPEGLRNEDALALLAAANVAVPYRLVNPYAFAPAIAPHIAAAEAGVRVRVSVLDEAHAALARQADAVLVEGAGGWLVPINDDLSFGGWVAQRGWPVLLVVGMRLGCLNHALLSAEAIGRRSRLVGWVANGLEQAMDRFEENLLALQQRMPAPCWGVVPPAQPAGATFEAARLEAWWTASGRGGPDES